MDIATLQASPIGRLVDIRCVDPKTGQEVEYFAYVPEPLPDIVDLSQSTWTAAASAMEALGKLAQACSQLPNPRLLIAPALWREAIATSALEGTYGTLPEVLEARLPQFKPPSPEVREIGAYERMAEMAFSWVGERSVTISMLCQLQEVLAESSTKPVVDPGRVREHQVIIGPDKHCSIYDARFVPAPPTDLLRAGLDDWQQWILEDHSLPIVVRAALAHYQFETLHPFGDGNGRVGRLVIILQLLRAGTLKAPALTISPWLLARRDEYQDHLLNVSRTGDWNPWIQFFCDAITAQCGTHVAVTATLLEWVTNLRRELQERRWGGVISKIAENLIDWPVITTRSVMEEYGVSNPTAKSAIDRLVTLDAIQEMTGGSYARVWGARAVMDAVESL